jgi:hypothetical protein
VKACASESEDSGHVLRSVGEEEYCRLLDRNSSKITEVIDKDGYWISNAPGIVLIDTWGEKAIVVFRRSDEQDAFLRNCRRFHIEEALAILGNLLQ